MASRPFSPDTGITYPYVDQYLSAIDPDRSALLRELESYAELHHVPIIGPVEARLIALLARSIGASRILELGTAIGYSTIWLAEVAQERGGKVTTLERDREMAELARANLRKAKLSSAVELLLGEADDTLAQLDGPFDLIFQDADKEQYSAQLEPCVRLLRSGGLLVTDNVLWGGSVCWDDPDPVAQKIREYNGRLVAHPQLETAFIPLRDGVAISRKR